MLSREIAKYIDNEIEISRYKISSMKKSSNTKPSQKRILEIEEEFCSIPFYKMEFDSVSDVAAAFRIFRESRSLFYKIYFSKDIFSPAEKDDRNISDICNSIESKFEFLSSKASEMMHVRPQEINIIQDSQSRSFFLREMSKKFNTSINKQEALFNNKSFKDSVSFEPAKVSRFRARKQACIFSSGKYIEDSCDNLMYKYSSMLSSDKHSKNDLLRIESLADGILLNLDKNIFKNYNYSIKNIKNIIQNTMGSNNSCDKIRPLKNCLYTDSDFPQPISISNRRSAARIENLFYGAKLPIKHSLARDRANNTFVKSYGILMPIKRVGNEKLTPLYLDLWTDFDVCINQIILDKISNTMAVDPSSNTEFYYKSIFLLPMWKILDCCFSNIDIELFVSRLFGISIDTVKDLDFNDSSLFKTKLCSSYNFVEINMEKSAVLAPATRSEEDWFSSKINDIKTSILDMSDIELYKNKYTINNGANSV